MILFKMISKNLDTLSKIAPIVIGSMLAVSFGTMLGWSSVAFPYLVESSDSPVPLEWGDTALLAGTLMIGNIIGTLVGRVSIRGPKTGVFLSFCFQIAGWLVMFWAHKVFMIGVSRALIGFGNGYGTISLRNLVKEGWTADMFNFFVKYYPVTVNVGILLAYIIGSFVEFRVLSLVFVSLPVVSALLFILVPKIMPPKPQVVPAIYEPEKTKEPEKSPSMFVRLKDGKVRKKVLWVLFFSAIPQYTGAAANIVYSQHIHDTAGNPHPKLSAIIYSIMILCSSIIAIRCMNKFPRKLLVLTSSCVSLIILILVFLNFYFLAELSTMVFFKWSPLCLLLVYNLVHSMGLNISPILYINDQVSRDAVPLVTQVYVISSSTSAILSTKLFQVMFVEFGMHMSYVYLLCFAAVGTLVILLFMKDPLRSKRFSVNSIVDGNVMNQENLRTSIVD